MTIMKTEDQINEFLSQYDEQVFVLAHKLREVLLANLPEIIEQLDIKAKMVAYCYGQRYADMICVIIPSKKGLKLGLNRDIELPDPMGMLEGKGKISRYVEIKSEEQVVSKALRALVLSTLELYKRN